MSYEFRVGQKVILVDDIPLPGCNLDELKRGEVYTIESIYPYKYRAPLNAEHIGIMLVGVIPRYKSGDRSNVPFLARRFRPLVSDTQPWLKEILEKPPAPIAVSKEAFSDQVMKYIFGSNHNGR